MTSWYQYPISHGYITSHLNDDWDSPHYAVDIAMPMDTPITAIKSGTVEQADYAVWGGKQGGGEVWIKPDDGSPEYYYYHLDQNMVSSGQHVSSGQQVGLSGGQNQGGSHPTDPSWSTGQHLHVGEFTKFVDTPIGSRPYGPDITPVINQLKIGGISYTGVTPSQEQSSSIDWVSIGRRGAILVVGIIVILVGGIFLVGGGSYGIHNPK